VADFESNQLPDITPTPDTNAGSSSELSDAPPIVGYLVSLMMIAIATLMAVGVDSEVKIPNLSLIYVVPVIAAAVAFGLGPSLFSAVLGALAYNFFLTEPRYSLAVDDMANIWAIGLLFLVGLIVSGVAFTSHRRATDAVLLRKQAIVLQSHSRDVVAAKDVKAIIAITAQTLAALFKVPLMVMIVTEGKVVSFEKVGSLEAQDADLEAARSSLASATSVRAGIYPNLASRYDFWPVATTLGPSVVIGLAFDPDERPATPGVLVDVVASVLALALDRHHFRARRDALPKD
jgi:K+-sensing histidine kinase KdpD